MRKKYNNSNKIGGISRISRQLLSRLHQAKSEPFTVAEAASILGIERKRATQLLSSWASRGWLSNVRRDLYITVPLSARHPNKRKEDPWIVTKALFEPGYIGGWSACEHWELTEQIFKDIVVFTTRNIRTREQIVQDTTYIIRVFPPEKLWGIELVWHGQSKIAVSDPTRTIVDILNEPKIGGGIRHCAGILENYIHSTYRNDNLLMDYLSRFKNRTIAKRLGYLLESLEIDSNELVEFCRSKISTGYSKLDPKVRNKGKILRRWNLEVNVNIKG